MIAAPGTCSMNLTVMEDESRSKGSVACTARGTAVLQQWDMDSSL
jgi:hypothetical protein